MKLLSKEQVTSHVEAIASNGYSIMEGAIAPNFLNDINEELDRLENVRPGGDIPPGPFTGLVTCLLYTSPSPRD